MLCLGIEVCAQTRQEAKGFHRIALFLNNLKKDREDQIRNVFATQDLTMACTQHDNAWVMSVLHTLGSPSSNLLKSVLLLKPPTAVCTYS